MKKFFTIAFIAALIFNCCMQEEINAPLNSAVAVATMEGEVAKSNVGDGGYFKWAENDAIAIHTTSGVIEGELIDGAGTSSTSFRYSLFEGQQLTNYAMYPYNANHEIEGSTLTFVMPAEYNLGAEISNTNAPMLAVPGAERNATATYNFSHLGGVFRFVFKNAPVGTSKLTLSLGGSKINGEFTADLDAETPVLVTGIAEEGENVTTINFTPLASAQDITIYVPVPTGEYTGITAELYNGAEKLGSWGKATAVNTVDRRTLKKMAAITFGTASGDIDNEVSVATEQQLINAVQNSGTVTLSENIEVTSTINILNGKDVTLDLNGNEITLGGSIAVRSGSNAAIKTWGYTSVEISNSTIIGSGNALSVDSSKATLSGSTFTGGLYGLHSFCAVVDYEACTISGASHDMYVQTASENNHSVTYNNVINGTTYTPADATFASGLFVEL